MRHGGNRLSCLRQAADKESRTGPHIDKLPAAVERAAMILINEVPD
jgi:hypothetical protein